jgi:hypothetical protein
MPIELEKFPPAKAGIHSSVWTPACAGVTSTPLRLQTDYFFDVSLGEPLIGATPQLNAGNEGRLSCEYSA